MDDKAIGTEKGGRIITGAGSFMGSDGIEEIERVEERGKRNFISILST